MVLSFTLSPDRYAICKLPATSPVPTGFLHKPFFAVTRTSDELSIVLSEKAASPEWESEKGWRMLKVNGPLDFNIVGVVASISAPLAEAGIPIFVISTFDTDYLLVKDENLASSIRMLEGEGHEVQSNDF
ncbi:MAG: ACT domain-containing protein [Rhodothermaceae bacterium]|nr:ACT domain-containing protein [Rhodothermaceae bacterium]